MRVFLRLGNPQLLASGLCENIAENILQFDRREKRCDERVKSVGILDHAERRCEIDDPPAIKSIERRVQQGRQNFSRSIRAEIQHQNAVTVLHTAVAVNRRRFDELIRRTRFVGRFHGGDRICSPFAMGVDKQFVGPRHTVPAFVPVHCEITTANRPDFCVAGRFGKFREILRGRRRRRIAAVQQRMYTDRHAGRVQHLCDRGDLVLVRVYTTRRHQTDEMCCATAFSQGILKRYQFRIDH